MQREHEKSSLESAVTTDLANDPEAEAQSDTSLEDHYEENRLVASGLGLIKVDGIDKRYVGMPVALDQFNPTEEGGLKLTTDNTTFIALYQVPFSNSIEIKDPATGTFYYPADGVTRWEDCELDGALLVPELEPPPEPPVEGGATSEARTFAGDGTDTLAVDVITGAPESVAIEGDVYPVPAYSLNATSDALVTSDASVWQAGVNVNVTAVFADEGTIDAASAKSKSKKDAKKSGKRR